MGAFDWSFSTGPSWAFNAPLTRLIAFFAEAVVVESMPVSYPPEASTTLERWSPVRPPPDLLELSSQAQQEALTAGRGAQLHRGGDSLPVEVPREHHGRTADQVPEGLEGDTSGIQIARHQRTAIVVPPDGLGSLHRSGKEEQIEVGMNLIQCRLGRTGDPRREPHRRPERAAHPGNRSGSRLQPLRMVQGLHIVRYPPEVARINGQGCQLGQLGVALNHLVAEPAQDIGGFEDG